MASNSDIVMETINDVENVLNNKFVDILTKTSADDIQPNLLVPPFDEENIFLDNEAGNPPPTSTTSEYIKFVVNYGGSIKDSKGVYNRVALATAQIFTPLGTGWKRSGDIFTAVRKALQDCGWSGQVMTVTDVAFLKLEKSGGMRMCNIDISIQYFEGV